MQIGTQPLITYMKGRPLLVADPEQQLLLQQTGGMSNWQMNALNRVLLQLTGFSIHSSKNTLMALTDGKMPDYVVETQKLIVNGFPQDWRVF